MFKRFFHPEELDRQLEDLIADAANRLDIGEFQVFQLAYVAWHGRTVQGKELERIFFDYLLKDIVPSWARHYARGIVELHDAGKLENHLDEYHRFDPEGIPTHGRGWKYFVVPIMLFAVFLFLFFIVITDPAFNPPVPTCYFPPC